MTISSSEKSYKLKVHYEVREFANIKLMLSLKNEISRKSNSLNQTRLYLNGTDRKIPDLCST